MILIVEGLWTKTVFSLKVNRFWTLVAPNIKQFNSISVVCNRWWHFIESDGLNVNSCNLQPGEDFYTNSFTVRVLRGALLVIQHLSLWRRHNNRKLLLLTFVDFVVKSLIMDNKEYVVWSSEKEASSHVQWRRRKTFRSSWWPKLRLTDASMRGRWTTARREEF